MARPLKVLILEDRASDAELVVYELRRAGFEPDWQRVDNEADYLVALEQHPAIILADYSMPQWDAPRALAVLQSLGLDIPFIVVSGTVGEDIAVECVRSGAADYLLKDRLIRLGQAVNRALDERRLRAEKQHDEEEIRRLKEFNENIIQTMAEGIVMVDPAGIITFVNTAGSAILGYRPEELIDQHRDLVVPPDQRPVLIEEDRRREQGLSDHYEVDLLRQNGDRRTVLMSGTPRFENNRYVGSLAVFTDITERKRIEQAEQEQRALAEALSDTAAILTSSLDFDTVMNRILALVGRVVPHEAANIMLIEDEAAHVVAHLGYEAHGQPAPSGFEFPMTMPHLHQMFSTGQPVFVADVNHFEGWVKKNGTLWIGSYAAAPIRVKGLVIGFLNLDSSTPGFYTQEHARRLQTFADQAAAAIQNAQLYAEIRQRVAERTAELARAKEQVESALAREIELNEIKSRFISIASHEFRTPMAVIQSCAGVLENYGSRLSPDQRRKEFERIRTSITQMVDLLDDVLLINKTEAGKLELHPETLNLEMSCREIMFEYERTIGVDHHFVFSAENACVHIWIDPKLLRHIVGNLLSNAVKYSETGTTVTFNVQCEDSQVVISVRDQGIGIPKEDQPHLFEAFYRADNVGSVPGTGLGLAIVKQMVDLHQGTISLESASGIGTVFTVHLPLMLADESQPYSTGG